MDPSIKQAHEAAQAKLTDKDGNPTPHYQAYWRFKDEYNGKVKARDKAYAAALIDPKKLQNWPIEGRTYQDGVDKAMDRWVSLGFKFEIENAIAALKAQGMDPSIKQAYEATQAKLTDKDGNPTPHYQAYRRFEDEYNSKVKARDKAYAAAFTDPKKLQNWPIEGRIYQDEVDKAMDRWVSLGFKFEIENAIAALKAQEKDKNVKAD